MWTDVHVHLDKYAEGREAREVLSEIERERIFTIAVAMDEASYRRTCKLAERRPLILPAFGIHPWEAPKHQRHLESFQSLIDGAALLGEIGLDFRFVKDTDLYPAQRRVFEFFLAAARQQDKIVILHSSGAEEAVLEALERHSIERAIVHWYNGPEETFSKLAARRCYFSFGVELGRNPHLQELASKCPAELLLSETDNPGGARWLSGEWGMPRLIHGVVQTLAAVREVPVAEMQEQVRQNLLRLMGADPRLEAPRAALQA